MSDSSSRRSFLQVIAVGTLGCAGAGVLGCSSAAGGGGSVGTVSGGNVKDLAVGALRALSGQGVALGRDAQGVYAMSVICTHAGCDMSNRVSASGILCTCHGSQFDVNGNAVSGPARSPLEHYKVTIDGAGAITIDGGTTVSESTRAMPPMG